MAYALVGGHNKFVPGAAGNGYKEHEVARQMVDKVATYLRQLGETAYICTDDVGTTKKMVWENAVKNCNRAIGSSGRAISIHLNAYNGKSTGVEVLTISDKAMAKALSTAIAKVLSLTDRGVKDGSEIGFINSTKATADLIELCFIDNPNDIAKLMQNFDAVARVIAETLTGKRLGQPIPQSVAQPVTSTPSAAVVYEAHVQNVGWQGAKRNGETAGTTGQSLRLEALTVKLENSDAKLELEGHVENKGWTSLRTNGEVIGTIGESLRLEAIKMKADGLNVMYRVHVEDIGWMDWKKNGEVSGTTGQAKAIEAIEIKLI